MQTTCSGMIAGRAKQQSVYVRLLKSTFLGAAGGNFASCLHSSARCCQPESPCIHTDIKSLLFVYFLCVCVCAWITFLVACHASVCRLRTDGQASEWVEGGCLPTGRPVRADTGCGASRQIEFCLSAMFCAVKLVSSWMAMLQEMKTRTHGADFITSSFAESIKG